MTDANLMDADCVHGVTWYDCSECPQPGEWDDLDWDFIDEEGENWADIPLACGIENPESCESCQ
jgi:hypothetical protein